MYVPKFFSIDDWPEISRFIRENPLATIISGGDEYPVATHVALELEESPNGPAVLTGHVAKANPHWRSFASNPRVLSVFLSPIQHYVSSSWYNHPNVPTWNYMSVHVYGILRIVDGDRLKKSLVEMTNLHERVSSHPLSAEVLKSEIEKQISGIVGFEIEIEKVEAAYKMSQNRSDEDFASIIKELERLEDYNARMVAAKMAEMRKT